MQATVPGMTAQKASVATVSVGRLAIGAISVGELLVSNARMGITSGRAYLHNVRVETVLEFDLVWSLVVPFDWPFDDFVITERTSPLGSLTIPVRLGDAEVPTLRDIDLDVNSLTASGLSLTASPIDAVELANVTADGISASGVALPVNGFQLAGLGLSSLSASAIAVPGAGLGSAVVEHVGGDPLLLPRLGLEGLTLPAAAVGDITSGPLDIPVERAEPDETPWIPLGVLKAKLRVSASAGMRVDSMQLSGVSLDISAPSIELREVQLPYDLLNLTLSDLGVETIEIPTLGVA